MPPGKDTSSSAGKIFVKPSKEWVLPERAKPGRKVSADEPDDVSPLSLEREYLADPHRNASHRTGFRNERTALVRQTTSRR